MNDSPKSKVFCVGFQKTGTSSFRDALRQIGYSVTGFYANDIPLDELRATYVPQGLEIAKQYDAVQDMPWPLIYRELDEAFPDAKFVLTVRDVDNWYNSMLDHFGDKPTPMRQLTYGEDAPAPQGNERRYKEVFSAHNAAVREYFAGRDDFLILDLEKGDGWDKLGPFIGMTNPPTGPFVHSNKAETRNSLGYKVGRLYHKVRRLTGLSK